MKALLIVDLQNDFVPGGALEVPEGDKIIPAINRLMDLNFDLIVASKDWHPANHGSFAKTHSKAIGDHVSLEGIDQVLWPVHCVQHTPGAEFVPSFHKEKVQEIIHKGIDPKIDSYSAFYDNCRLRSTGLEELLHKRNIKEVYIVGLAVDYCVKFSALDAVRLGFRTYVVKDACRGVNLKPGDTENAFEEMVEAGVTLIDSRSLLNGAVFP